MTHESMGPMDEPEHRASALIASQVPSPAANPPKSLGEQPVTQQDLSRLRRLLWVFAVLLALLITPTVVSRIQYALVEAKERAQLDVAREYLQDFNLHQLSTASRLLANSVGPSVVQIRTQRNRRGVEGQGSGVIVDSEGYVVTNFHVVEQMDSVEIQLSDGRRGSAYVVGVDPLVDVAVLKTDLPNLIAAEWGDSDSMGVGDMVWAIGAPFGFEKTTTFGILSGKERRGITSPRYSIYQEFLQTDAAVNPGNSGGPLVNVEGKIIGINTAIYGRTYQGISFSIPSTIARASYEQLRKEGYVQRGYLGVGPSKLPAALADELGLEPDEGVLVIQVQPDTPASRAGIRQGDVILTWDGELYSDPTLLSRAIAGTPVGAEVEVELVRLTDDGVERLTVEVKVSARPRIDPL